MLLLFSREILKHFYSTRNKGNVKSLSFSHSTALNKSFLNAVNGWWGKGFQFYGRFHSVDLPESGYTFQSLTTILPNISEALLKMRARVEAELRSRVVERIHNPCHNQTWNPCRTSSTLQSTFIYSQEFSRRPVHFWKLWKGMEKQSQLIHRICFTVCRRWMNFDSFYCKLELCKISAFFLF